MFARLRDRVEATLVLARWLGPWADPAARPARVVRERLRLDPTSARPLEAALVRPVDRPPNRAILVSPGLHFRGPDDPRFERFTAILARSGALVLAPFVPDYLDLRVTIAAANDLDRALAALLARPDLPAPGTVTLFSISFGSLLALQVAATSAHRARLRAAIVFGGYARFDRTIRYAVTGEVDGRRLGRHDPLNRPVAFMNVLHRMGLPEVGEPEGPLPRRGTPLTPLFDAWHAYVEATWGREELKVDRAFEPIARAHAERLEPRLRELFLVGCGVSPGGDALVDRALARFTPADLAIVDPTPFLADVRCPVHLVHGRDDDVIPALESEELHRRLSPHTETTLALTGLYAHTASARARPAELLREARTLGRVLATLRG